MSRVALIRWPIETSGAGCGNGRLRRGSRRGPGDGSWPKASRRHSALRAGTARTSPPPLSRSPTPSPQHPKTSTSSGSDRPIRMMPPSAVMVAGSSPRLAQPAWRAVLRFSLRSGQPLGNYQWSPCQPRRRPPRDHRPARGQYSGTPETQAIRSTIMDQSSLGAYRPILARSVSPSPLWTRALGLSADDPPENDHHGLGSPRTCMGRIDNE
jgi:hypothetical protein